MRRQSQGVAQRVSTALILCSVAWADEATVTRSGANSLHNLNSVFCSVGWWADSHKEWRTYISGRWRILMPLDALPFKKVWAGTAVDSLVVACEVANRVAGIHCTDFHEKHFPSIEECTPKCSRKHVCSHDGAFPLLSFQVRNWLSNHLPDTWSGLGGPVIWPLCSPGLRQHHFSLSSLFWKNRSRLMMSVIVCVYVYPPISFWLPELIFMNLGTRIMAPEPISTPYFINPSH
jgi:hypothetical protein